jgi:hypothetical protein
MSARGSPKIDVVLRKAPISGPSFALGKVVLPFTCAAHQFSSFRDCIVTKSTVFLEPDSVNILSFPDQPHFLAN